MTEKKPPHLVAVGRKPGSASAGLVERIDRVLAAIQALGVVSA